jgi:hypothetical protein
MSEQTATGGGGGGDQTHFIFRFIAKKRSIALDFRV